MGSTRISRARSLVSRARSIVSHAGSIVCHVRSIPPVAPLTPVLVVLVVAGCGAAGATSAGKGQILAVGAENEYADVISQIGGRYVRASAILSDPNTDPHTFEASPSVAGTVSSAQLIVQNGLGY